MSRAFLYQLHSCRFGAGSGIVRRQPESDILEVELDVEVEPSADLIDGLNCIIW
jgi:hypothetical protein